MTWVVIVYNSKLYLQCDHIINESNRLHKLRRLALALPDNYFFHTLSFSHCQAIGHGSMNTQPLLLSWTCSFFFSCFLFLPHYICSYIHTTVHFHFLRLLLQHPCPIIFHFHILSCTTTIRFPLNCWVAPHTAQPQWLMLTTSVCFLWIYRSAILIGSYTRLFVSKYTCSQTRVYNNCSNGDLGFASPISTSTTTWNDM